MNLDKAQQSLKHMIENNPTQGLFKGEAFIDKSLDSYESLIGKPAMVLQAQKAEAVLRKGVEDFVEYIEMCILSHANGIGGFRTDPTGLLSGVSKWSTSPQAKKKYPRTYHLIDQYAQEYIKQKIESSKGGSEAVSQTAIAQALDAQDESSVEIPLNNGDTLKMDRDENLIGVTDGTTGKTTWFKSKVDLAKGWCATVMDYLKQWGLSIWNWLVSKYQQAKSFVFDTNEEVLNT